MSLDLRTMMVVIAAMSFLFAGLLELAGLHAGNVRGVRLWALASLCISIGLSFAIAMLTPSDGWVLVAGATFVGAGAILQFVGIQAFKDEQCDWRIPAVFTLAIFVSTTWFAVIHPNIEARSITNSLILALANAACASALLIPVKPPLRTAYWFTGAAFAALAVVFVIRAIVIMLSPDNSYGLYANLAINPATFFAASMTQLCVTFGFVLMLNYRLANDLHDLASHDQLTGALNRRGLEEEATRLQARCLRNKVPLAVMLIDVDHFKQINDQYGHLTGDEVLKRLTAVVQMSIRVEDYFARYGGEEFCVLLPAATEQDVMVMAERLRQNYEATLIRAGDETLTSTISIGVADSTHTGMVFNFLVATADQAMYRAKETGRNRVVAYSSMVATT
jgi:diguanylate cyclase (GGDEF)-like protein